MTLPTPPADRDMMQRAIALARRGQGSVEPNPMVGCVLVRGGRIVGEGYHRRFGGPHAEVHALRQAGDRARGATAYVTLEPCCHHGKTPPCTEALIAAGVGRVVAAIRDPFAPVAGKGLTRLRRAGIEVRLGVCQDEARRLAAPYLTLQLRGRPWVILKWAQSLDGRIATRTGDSRWISSEPSRAAAHRLRGRVDAVVVGVRTVLADDPLLTCRHGRPRRIAARIVLDPRLRTPPECRLAATARSVPLMIVTAKGRARGRKARMLAGTGAELLEVPCGPDGLDLTALLAELGRRRMSNILVEGGGHTLGAFMDAGLADEAVIFVSRRLIGGQEAPAALAGTGPARMRDVPTPAWTQCRRCGTDDLYRLGLTDPARLHG